MPLVMLCGYPCSGKSRVAQHLQKHLEAEGKKVVVITDDSIGIDRNSTYHSTAGNEKETRSSLRSEAQKHLGRDTVVILDSLNYIKGFRYELYCISKNIKTPHCVIHTDTSHETCTKYNDQVSHYNPELIDELIMRFEKPNPNQRWDNPCFTITPDTNLNTIIPDITNSLFNAGAPRPNQSTQSQALAAPGFLHQIDTMTQEVIEVINTQQNMGNVLIKIPGVKTMLELNRTVNMAELRRIKRQFITYTKAHPPANLQNLKEGFVQYLHSTVL